MASGRSQIDLVDALFAGLDILHTKGSRLMDRALANLAVGLVTSAKNPVARRVVVDEWHHLQLGGDNDSIQAAIDFAVNQGWLVEEKGALRPDGGGATTLETQISDAFELFVSALIGKHGPDAFDRHLDAAVRPFFGACVRELMRHSVEVAIRGNQAAVVDWNQVRDACRTIEKSHPIAQGRNMADLFVEWVRQSQGKALGPLAANLAVLAASVRLFAGRNAFGKANREALSGSIVVWDANVLIHYLCPASSDWSSLATQSLDDRDILSGLA